MYKEITIEFLLPLFFEIDIPRESSIIEIEKWNFLIFVAFYLYLCEKL